MKILSKVLDLNAQALVISVNYDPNTNTVGEIKRIDLVTQGQMLPVGNLMMKYFEPAINAIIDETDWREVYKTLRAAA